jgi:thioredoxin-like negative regulator of GroEL
MAKALAQIDIVDEAGFIASIDKSDMPSVVTFYAPWCEPCTDLIPILEGLAKEFPQICFFRYNMDKLYRRADRLGIEGIPSTLLFRPKADSDGDALLANRILGYVTEDYLRPKLRRLLGQEEVQVKEEPVEGETPKTTTEVEEE